MPTESPKRLRRPKRLVRSRSQAIFSPHPERAPREGLDRLLAFQAISARGITESSFRCPLTSAVSDLRLAWRLVGLPSLLRRHHRLAAGLGGQGFQAIFDAVIKHLGDRPDCSNGRSPRYRAGSASNHDRRCPIAQIPLRDSGSCAEAFQSFNQDDFVTIPST